MAAGARRPRQSVLGPKARAVGTRYAFAPGRPTPCARIAPPGAIVAARDASMLVTLSTRTVYENRYVTLRQDAVRYPDGAEGDYTFIKRPDYAIVAAIEDGHVWMVEQWRHPMGARSWELPMGVAPGGDAIPVEESARIELREETGVTAAAWREIGRLNPAPALIAQTGVLFLATGLTMGAPALEATEQDLIARPWPIGDVIAAVLDGRIRDAATIAAVGVLRLRELI
jgi:ADP-ribose pyrophosphatase